MLYINIINKSNTIDGERIQKRINGRGKIVKSYWYYSFISQISRFRFSNKRVSLYLDHLK